MTTKRAAQLALFLMAGMLVAAFLTRPSSNTHRRNMGMYEWTTDQAAARHGRFDDYLLATSFSVREGGALIMQCWGAFRTSICTAPEGQAHRESF